MEYYKPYRGWELWFTYRYQNGLPEIVAWRGDRNIIGLYDDVVRQIDEIALGEIREIHDKERAEEG